MSDELETRAGDGSEITGFVAEGTSFHGRLAFVGGFRVDGHVTGEVDSEASLIVGPPGSVDVEELKVGKLSVSGLVRGRMRVEERLEIHSGGRVYGDLVMSRPGLVIEPGGVFEGTIEMEGQTVGPANGDAPAVPAISSIAQLPEAGEMSPGDVEDDRASTM